MNPLLPSIPTLAVSCIYCLWWTYQQRAIVRRRVLRERVAYMLWVMATELE